MAKNSSEGKTSAFPIFIHPVNQIPWQAKLKMTLFINILKEGLLEWEPTKLRISLEIHLFYQCWANMLKMSLYTQIRSLKCCYLTCYLFPPLKEVIGKWWVKIKSVSWREKKQDKLHTEVTRKFYWTGRWLKLQKREKHGFKSNKDVREGADIKPGRMRVISDKSLSAVLSCKLKSLTPGILSTKGEKCRRDILKLGILKGRKRL